MKSLTELLFSALDGFRFWSKGPIEVRAGRYSNGRGAFYLDAGGFGSHGNVTVNLVDVPCGPDEFFVKWAASGGLLQAPPAALLKLIRQSRAMRNST